MCGDTLELADLLRAGVFRWEVGRSAARYDLTRRSGALWLRRKRRARRQSGKEASEYI
jgi:hypothetical protein